MSTEASPAVSISAQAGVPFDLPITAYDPYQNVATSYAGTLHFTSSDPNAGAAGGLFVHARGQGGRTRSR